MKFEGWFNFIQNFFFFSFYAPFILVYVRTRTRRLVLEIILFTVSRFCARELPPTTDSRKRLRGGAFFSSSLMLNNTNVFYIFLERFFHTIPSSFVSLVVTYWDPVNFTTMRIFVLSSMNARVSASIDGPCMQEFIESLLFLSEIMLIFNNSNWTSRHEVWRFISHTK